MEFIFLKKYINIYEKNKVSLLRYWLSDDKILKILKHHNIKTDLFVKTYAIAIIDYYIAVVNGKIEIGNCPALEEFLFYSKDKNITTSELFVICIGLKNAMIEFSYDLKITNLQIEKEINYVFEENFSKVLKLYSTSLLDIKKELKSHENILIEQSKSAGMGEMISMIAHQWRQPLQAVSILIQKLPLTKTVDGEISDELLNYTVDSIGKQLEYMSKTIDDFRDFFLPDKPKEIVSLKDLLTKALDFISFMMKTDSIKVEISGKEDVNINVNANELVQVLINILKNAKDAMIGNDICSKEINIRHYKKNDWAFIEIEDNGKGILEENIPKIFEPYFSTKSNKNGTGIGLYMCKTIIEKHFLGKLTVANSQKGAIFKIELPIL